MSEKVMKRLRRQAYAQAEEKVSTLKRVNWSYVWDKNSPMGIYKRLKKQWRGKIGY